MDPVTAPTYFYPYTRPSWLAEFRTWLWLTVRCAAVFMLVVGYSMAVYAGLFIAAKAAL